MKSSKLILRRESSPVPVRQTPYCKQGLDSGDACLTAAFTVPESVLFEMKDFDKDN
jgi:hypothetical protein